MANPMDLLLDTIEAHCRWIDDIDRYATPEPWIFANCQHLLCGPDHQEIAVFSKDDDWEREQEHNRCLVMLSRSHLPKLARVVRGVVRRLRAEEPSAERWDELMAICDAWNGLLEQGAPPSPDERERDGRELAFQRFHETRRQSLLEFVEDQVAQHTADGGNDTPGFRVDAALEGMRSLPGHSDRDVWAAAWKACLEQYKLNNDRANHSDPA